MAEFSSPILGGIRVARSTVSSSVFGIGRPAISESQGPDPTTISILSKNELALTSVSNQIAGMSQQIMSLSASIQQIGISIANDSALDRQRELQKQNRERLLAQQQLREGKESLIEKKIQNALISPVRKIAAQTKFTLERLGSFFNILLGGWIANQSIQTIQALITGNKRKLEEIKNNIIKNLGVVGGILLAVNGGLFALASIATRIIRKITSSVVKGLFLNPVKALINAVKNAANGLLGLGKGAAAEGATKGATEGAIEGATKGAIEGAEEGGLLGIGKNAFSTVGKSLRGFGLPLLTGSLFTGYDIYKGESPGRAIAGTTGGMLTSTAAFTLGSILPIPGSGVFAGGVAYGPGEKYAKGLYDKFFGAPTPAANTPEPSTPTTTKTAAEPKESGKQESQDFSQPPEFGTMNIAPTAGESGANNQAAGVTPQGQPIDYSSVFSGSQAQIQPFKPQSQQKMQSVGPLPEPQPTVVMAPAPPAPVQSAPYGGGPANNVPAIPSANPDNFYVLYSQAHYNVVM